MKKFGMLLAMVGLSTVAFAQSGNSETLHIAATKVSAGIGNNEILEVRVSGNNVSQISDMVADFGGSRVAYMPMTKVSTEYSSAPGNSGNNGTDVWVVSIDLDNFEDSNGDVNIVLRPSCCYIPGAIVVRSKGR